jgi:molecular chaperone HscB
MSNRCRSRVAPASADALRYLRSAIVAQSNATTISRVTRPVRSSCIREIRVSLSPLSQSRSFSSSHRRLSDSPPKAPQTHYDFFPNTFPAGPPPKGDFSLSLRELRNEFLRLQAQAHPDLHPAERKKQAEALSSRINEAYKTLQSPLLRAQYLLSLRGETAHEDDAAKLGDASEDQELLMEVLELREAIEEAQVQEDVDAIKRENEERVRESVKVLEGAFKEDDIDTARKEAVKLRYWINVEETLHAWEEGKPAPSLQH